MTAADLKKVGALYFENIKDGLTEYENEIVSMDAGEAEQQFRLLWEQNGVSNSYVDFYYYCLGPDEQRRVESVLSEAEVTYLHDHSPARRLSAGDIIFPLDEMLIKIVAKLNETEMLFSTLYFLQEKSTWWGNYKQEYIVFR